MNTRVILTSAAVLAAVAVTPVVIGRYGVRADVLLGFALVATLVALITSQYGRRASRAARQPVVLRPVQVADVIVPNTKIVELPNPGNRAAA